MIEIKNATKKTQYDVIAELANITWREHYTSIIGIEQVEYMLEKFQSSSAIEDQVLDGYEYFIISYEGTPVGYISIRNENDTLFLSKIYILSTYRGKKIGKAGLQFIEEKAKQYQLKTITLTVNKNNINTIAAYQKLGFIKERELVIDIGNGFVMDDYKMVRLLN